MYKCVIFDLGYTLIEHNDEIETMEVARILNIPYSEEFKKEIAHFWKNAGELTRNNIITKEFYCSIIERMFPYIKQFNITPEKFFLALCQKPEIGIYPNTIEILEFLCKNNIKIYGLSNWFKDDQIKELKNLKIIKYFDNIFGWDNSLAKPNPDVLKNNILKYFKNENVVFAGNDINIDIKCAKNAEIDSIWVNYNNEENKTTINPTYEISNLLDIEGIIKNRK